MVTNTQLVEIRHIPGGATLDDAHAVRREVFIEEQGVSETEEMDGRDADARHVVAYISRSGTDSDTPTDPVGTARLRIPEPRLAKPERVAVRQAYRGEGIGQQLMRAIEDVARQEGCTRARLHAQTAVEEFYRNLGYETTSDVFEEAGIPHVKMEKDLTRRS